MMTSQKAIHDSPSIIDRLKVKRKTIQDMNSECCMDEINDSLDLRLINGIDIGYNSLEDPQVTASYQQPA